MIKRFMLYLSLILSVESLHSCKESTVLPDEYPSSVNHGSGFGILYTKYNPDSRIKSLMKYDISRNEYTLLLNDAMLTAENVFSDDIPLIRETAGEIQFFNIFNGTATQFSTYTNETSYPLFTLGNKKILTKHIVRLGANMHYEILVADKSNPNGVVIADDVDYLFVPVMNENKSKVAYLTSAQLDPTGRSRLVCVDINGENLEVLGNGFINCPSNSGSLSWYENRSKSINKIAGVKSNQITVLDLVTKSETTLTFDDSSKASPTFSSKGDRIAYLGSSKFIQVVDCKTKDDIIYYTIPKDYSIINRIVWSDDDRYLAISMNKASSTGSQIVLIDLLTKDWFVVDTNSSYAVFY